MTSKQNDTLGTAFGDILVLALLGVGQVVVLVKQRASVDAVCFAVPTLDDTNTTASNISEAQVETAELGADDQEHAVQGLGVLVLGQEVRLQAEAEGHLGGGEEVGLEDGGVEDAERVHDHLVVLVDGGVADQLLELGVRQDLVDLQAEVTEGGQEVISSGALGLNVVGVGEVKVELVDQLGIFVDDLENVVGSESLGTETLLDLRQKFGVDTVVVI